MPITEVEATQELAIQLENRLASYSPGDAIAGRVVRKTHTVSTRGWVTIRLFGRAKSKLTIRRNNGNNTTTHHYRGRFNFFAPNGTCQKIFDGPVHIPPDGSLQEWPFTLVIPTGPSPSSVKAGNLQDRSFLPLDVGTIAASSLPSSFAFSNHRWREQFHCFVEYYLEAEFRQEKKSQLSRATLPIVVLATSSTYPFESFDLKARTYSGCIQTQRLIPGLESAELSFRQRTQKWFGSSKVPKFSFSIQVDCPAVIQLQNPNPIPFRIRIVPDRKQSSESLVDLPQTLALTSLYMQIEATTSIICDASFSPRTASGSGTYAFAPKGSVLGIRKPITIESGADSKALDLGALLGLSLHPQHANARGKPLPQFGKIYPSFVTYNIKHSHRLRWELSLETAGEVMKITGEQSVSILAAS
jgi:hypothetical protein